MSDGTPSLDNQNGSLSMDEELRKSEERFRSLVEYTSDWVWEIDENNRYKYSNPRSYELLGYEPEDILGKTPFDLMPPEEAGRVRRLFERIAAKRTAFALLENVLINREGNRVTVETSGVPLFDDRGEFRGYRGIDRDITSRKQVQLALRESEELLRAIKDSLPVELAVLDRDGNIITVNKAWEQFAKENGAASLRGVGMGINYLDVCRNAKGPYSEGAKEALQGLQAVLDGTLSEFGLEYPCPTPDRMRWFFMRATPLNKENGGLVVSHIDITERKRTEQALRESEEKYRNLVERASDGIVVIQDAILRYVNPSFSEMSGYPIDVLLGTPFTNYLTKEEIDALYEKRYKPRMAGAQVPPIYETVMTRSNGSKIELEINAGIISYEGKPADLVIFRDITERKRAERELLAREELLSTFIKHTPAAVAMFDTEMRYVTVSQRWLQDYGLGDRDIIGKSHYEIFPEIGEEWKNYHKRALAGETLSKEEDAFPRADGKIDWVKWEIVPWRKGDGSLGGIIMFTEVITERKLAQEALRESEERLSRIFETIPDGVLILNTSERVTFANATAENLLGISRGEMEGRDYSELWRSVTTPEGNPIPVEERAYRRARRTGEVIRNHEQAVERLDGKQMILSINVAPLRDSEQAIIGVVASLVDITERKKAAEDLRYRMNFEQLVTSISTEFVNLPADQLDEGINRALKSLAEFVKVDRSLLFLYSEAGRRLSLANEWHVEDTTTEMLKVRNVPTDAFPWFTAKMLNKEAFYVNRLEDLPPEAKPEQEQFASLGIRSFAGVPVVYGKSVIGFLAFDSVKKEKSWSDNDISLIRIVGEIFANALVRKWTEQALRASEQNFRTLFTNAPAAILSYDRNGRVIQANPDCERFYGVPISQLINSSMFETIIRQEDQDRAKEMIKKVFKGETLEDMEFHHHKPDGTDVYVLTSTTPIYGPSGEVMMGLALSVDITERKLTEQRKIELEEQQRQFYRQTILAATGGKLTICEPKETLDLGARILSQFRIECLADTVTARHRAEETALDLGMSRKRAESLSLCVGEAATNAVKHAGGGEATIATDDESIFVRISDTGAGMDALVLPRVILERGYSTGGSLGMGFALILSLADHVCLDTGPHGTSVVMEMALKERTPSPSIDALPDTW